MSENSIKERIIYFDILNILSIIAVIFMHCNGIVHDTPLIKEWNFSLFIDCIMYWAVPVFFILSGATLLNYRERYSTKTFFKKRVKKVVIPFIFWAGFMFIWKTATNQLFLPDNNFFTILKAFFTNKEEYTYYFMFEIIALYLTIPLLSHVIKKDDLKRTKVMLFSLIIVNILLVLLSNHISIYYLINLLIQYISSIIYALIGHLLYKYNPPKKYRIMIYFLAILGIVYRYISTYTLSNLYGYVVKDTWGYNKIHCILLGVSVFLIFKNINFNKISENNRIKKTLLSLSSCTFGIFLIHLVVRYYLIYLLNISITSLFFRTIGPIIVYILSLLIVLIIKKIPVFRHTVP